VKYGGVVVVSRAGCAKSGVNPDKFIHQAVDRYDGEILHNDWSLEQLAGKLQQLGILDNTLIVVVSDHGEEFWEHGWTSHGHTLYQELTRSEEHTSELQSPDHLVCRLLLVQKMQSDSELVVIASADYSLRQLAM